jgi:Zn-dependent protease
MQARDPSKRLWHESECGMRDYDEGERARSVPPAPYHSWPASQGAAAPAYPPPPEYYLSGPGRVVERQDEQAFPGPPPEHDMGGPYPSYPGSPASQWPTSPYPPQRASMGQAIAQAQPDTPWRALGRYLIFIISAAVSVLAFWLWTDNWELGVGIVALLFIHEMGHFIVIRAKGLPASLPVFIPLIGAYVTMRQMPRNVRDEAEIALAGPIAGGLAGLACLVAYQYTLDPALITLAYLTFLINLLNLVPVSPLDGGRIVGAISRWFWPVGLAALAVGFFYTGNLILLLVAIFGFAQTIGRFATARSRDPYYKISFLARLYVTTLYFGLAAALVLGMWVTRNGFFF